MKRIMELITDDSGKLSTGRALMILVVIVYLGYAGYVVYSTKTIPDFPVGVVGLVSLLYTANKFSPTVPFTGGQ